jgi:hypothetical protein
MPEQKYAIFGDIHGCIDELTRLFEILNDGTRKMISIGDLVDRGPDSVGCVRFVKDNFDYAVKGNHDSKLHRKIENDSVKYDYQDVLDEFRLPENAELVEWLKNLPTNIDFGDFVVAHAAHPYWNELRPKKIRDLNLYGFTDGILNDQGFPARLPWAHKWGKVMGDKLMIHGHNAVRHPEFNDGVVNVDTGCVYGGYLTAFLIPEMTFASVPAKTLYNYKSGSGISDSIYDRPDGLTWIWKILDP